MQHHFDSNLVPFEDTQSGTKEDPNRAVLELFAGPRGNFMYYWYGSLYVIVEGFQNLHLNDPGVWRRETHHACRSWPWYGCSVSTL